MEEPRWPTAKTRKPVPQRAPIITFLQRMAEDPDYLTKTNAFKLCRLAIRAAGALRIVHRAESEARRSMPLPEEPEEVEVFEFEDWEI